VLEVSLETSDTGLGMYSTVSEKPTLVRTAGFGDSWTSVVAAGSSTGGVDTSGARGSGTSETAIAVVVISGCDFSSLTNGSSWGGSTVAGLAGGLSFLTSLAVGGRMIEDKSWLEMAADLR
jgi:hypothetical protein